ncbi:poliovirus receptor-related protein 2 [Alligator mississippiensis]|uniref:Nectin cell adhesion molecule 3 n=1 Tax=Alligator mississippiensis TaxID=8496 RepID=A0A151PBB9_ALLMI|nr:poliovirus receptor-related protein 2 [Alligator mississippiensis]
MRPALGYVSLPQGVKVRPEVVAEAGQEVTLPCRLTPGPGVMVSQVTWLRGAGPRKTSLAVFHPALGPSYPQGAPGRARFLKPSLDEPSLVLGPLIPSDDDTYTCEFATFPHGNEDGVTRLLVLARPSISAESREVRAGGASTPVAVCTAAGAKPAANVTWRSSLLGSANATELPQSDGTVTVASQYNMVPSSAAHGQSIACVVTHPALPQPQVLPVVLSVLHPPEVTIDGYDDNWYLSRSDAILTCVAKGNPAPSQYSWSTSAGGPLPPAAEVRGPQLLVRSVDASVNTTFVCRVSNRVGTSAAEQLILVRAQPNTDGAGATGGIIGGLIAAVVAVAVVATGVLICRQQQKDRTERDDDLDGPPAYKPPPPCMKLEDVELAPPAPEQLKTPYFEPSVADGPAAPRYHELPTLEEPESELGPEPGLADACLDQINPIYDALVLVDDEASAPPRERDPPFFMSRAMYV